jgi:hypothetical protein
MFECLAKAVREGGHLFWAASAWAKACIASNADITNKNLRILFMSLLTNILIRGKGKELF